MLCDNLEHLGFAR